jgi:hypothetical protein
MLERDKARHRQSQLAAARQAPYAAERLLRTGWLRVSTLCSDHMRTVIIASVFGYKVGGWVQGGW